MCNRRNSAAMKSLLVSIVLLACSVLGASLGLATEPPITIKFSHVVAEDTPKGKAAIFFAKRAEELTKGAVKVEVYPNSTLYKDKEEMEALQLGAVHLLAPSLAKLGPLGPLGIKEFEVFDLPYLFDNMTMLRKVTQGSLGVLLLNKLDSKGIKGLAFWDNGFKSFSANRPLKTPADFNKLRMRIQSSKVLESQMRALGAVPQVTAFSDVYQALRTGFVDGTENPHSNFYTQKMYEVQKHVTITEHGYLGYAVIANKKFWDNLPRAIRTQVWQAMNEATDYANQIAKEENDNALAKIIETGKTKVYTPTPAERLEFKRVMVKTHREMAHRVGQEIINAIYTETGFNPEGL